MLCIFSLPIASAIISRLLASLHLDLLMAFWVHPCSFHCWLSDNIHFQNQISDRNNPWRQPVCDYTDIFKAASPYACQCVDRLPWVRWPSKMTFICCLSASHLPCYTLFRVVPGAGSLQTTFYQARLSTGFLSCCIHGKKRENIRQIKRESSTRSSKRGVVQNFRHAA